MVATPRASSHGITMRAASPPGSAAVNFFEMVLPLVFNVKPDKRGVPKKEQKTNPCPKQHFRSFRCLVLYKTTEGIQKGELHFPKGASSANGGC